MKTKPVDRNLAHNYLKKAEEFYGTMQDALIKKRWNAVASNAIHTGISSADSVAVFIKGLRSSRFKVGSWDIDLRLKTLSFVQFVQFV